MMKVPKSVRDVYLAQYGQYELLGKHVDKDMNALKERRWHYESRIKTLESFALKVETGRYEDPSEIEDFLGCTLVVENLGAMSRAEKIISKRFKVKERRPKSDKFTSKSSDSFRFDDTRLYVRWKDDPDVRPSGLNGLLFEVQIKTFIAHAWSIATHELTYKTDEKSWPKERIAYQVKAMLEHAETSIQEANRLAKSSSLKKTDDLSERISSIIALLNELWSPLLLPDDKKRLAENIDNLMRNVGIDLQTLREALLRETELGRGTNTLNLSPYFTIVQALFNQQSSPIRGYLTGKKHAFKIYIPDELQLPPSLSSSRLTNATLSSGANG